MTEKVQGSVKWFSNKKGYGFITPVEGSPISNDIFVHQSAIHSDGYRTLVSMVEFLVVFASYFQFYFEIFEIIKVEHVLIITCTLIFFFFSDHSRPFSFCLQDENWKVEFEIGTDESGKPKAENVTAPGGGPCTGPRKQQNRRRRHYIEDGDGTDAPKKREPQQSWHEILSDEVKQALQDKAIRTTTGTIDVAVGNARIKLGSNSYAAMANEDKILAEGSFECDADGHATFEWKRALRFTDVWNTFIDLKSLVSEVNLTDGKFEYLICKGSLTSFKIFQIGK